MATNVNKKITDKIKKSNFNNKIKGFIGEILIFELEHFEEARPQYMDEYGQLIRKYTDKFKTENK